MEVDQMKNKLLSSFLMIGMLTLCIIAIAMVKTVDAKSLYVITDHNNGELATYDINPDGTVINPTLFSIPDIGAGSVGLAIDANSTSLFISYEMNASSNFAIVDATKLELIGTVDDPEWSTFTGIDIDDMNNIFYAVTRFPDQGLYAYDWNPVAKTLTPKAGNPTVLFEDGGLALQSMK